MITSAASNNDARRAHIRKLANVSATYSTDAVLDTLAAVWDRTARSLFAARTADLAAAPAPAYLDDLILVSDILVAIEITVSIGSDRSVGQAVELRKMRDAVLSAYNRHEPEANPPTFLVGRADGGMAGDFT